MSTTWGRQRGYASLIALLMVLCILMTLAAMSLPNISKIIAGQNQSAARDRLLLVWRANAEIALCAAQEGCRVSVGVAALVPANGSSIAQQGYRFDYSAQPDGTWTYSATPLQPGFSGLRTWNIDQTGVLR